MKNFKKALILLLAIAMLTSVLATYSAMVVSAEEEEATSYPCGKAGCNGTIYLMCGGGLYEGGMITCGPPGPFGGPTICGSVITSKTIGACNSLTCPGNNPFDAGVHSGCYTTHVAKPNGCGGATVYSCAHG